MKMHSREKTSLAILKEALQAAIASARRSRFVRALPNVTL
jgi:hypothetical protein